MDWQPIETADKDTTNCVLLSDGKWVGLGWYSEHDGGWIDAEDCKFEEPFSSQPTHWMPLPQPPQPVPEYRLIQGGPCYDPRKESPWAFFFRCKFNWRLTPPQT